LGLKTNQQENEQCFFFLTCVSICYKSKLVLKCSFHFFSIDYELRLLSEMRPLGVELTIAVDFLCLRLLDATYSQIFLHQKFVQSTLHEIETILFMI
jgi:hypothetical protein